jgi:hypothetical protein
MALFICVRCNGSKLLNRPLHMVHAETPVPEWRGSITASDTLRSLHRVLLFTCAQNVSCTASFSKAGLTFWSFDDTSVVTTTVPVNEFSSMASADAPRTVTIDWQRPCGFFNDATALHISVYGSARIVFIFHYGQHISKEVVVHVSLRDDMEVLKALSATSRMPEMTRMVLASSDAARMSAECLGMCAPSSNADVLALLMNTRDVTACVFGERGLTLTMHNMMFRYRSYVPAVMEGIRGQTHTATVRARKLLTHVRNASSLNATMALGFCKNRGDSASSARLFAQVFWGARLGAETHVCVAPVVVPE